jgi:hypothetical protein
VSHFSADAVRWRTPASQFVRSDHPLVTSTNETLTTVFYPLSPDWIIDNTPAVACSLAPSV